MRLNCFKCYLVIQTHTWSNNKVLNSALWFQNSQRGRFSISCVNFFHNNFVVHLLSSKQTPVVRKIKNIETSGLGYCSPLRRNAKMGPSKQDFFLVLNFRIQSCFPFSLIINWWNKSPEWLISPKRLSLPSMGHKGRRDDSRGGLRVIWNVISFR